jgi:endonuclease/exonuclease/phosphatase family metal-dependent hydrolase
MQEIAGLSPDVLCLQEVDRFEEVRDGLEDLG